VSPPYEFAKTGSVQTRKNLPAVQRSRTRRLCRLRMALLVEERSTQRFADWGWLLVVVPSNSRLLFFQSLNDPSQPGSDCIFDLVKYQDLQEVALILLHLAPPTQFKICAWLKGAAVTPVTWQRDGHHSRGTMHSGKNMGIGCHPRDGCVCQAAFVLYRVVREVYSGAVKSCALRTA